MRAMRAEDKQREKRNKRSFERERRAQRKEQEDFFRNLQKAQKRAESERKKAELNRKINQFKFNRATDLTLLQERLGLGDAKYRNMSTAELLRLAKRSRYTR